MDGLSTAWNTGSRLEEKASHIINIKKRMAITEIWLPNDETTFHERKASG